MATEKAPRKILSDTVIEQLESIISEMTPGGTVAHRKRVIRTLWCWPIHYSRGLEKVLSYRKVVVRKNEGTFVAEKTSEGCLTDPLNLILNMNVGSLLHGRVPSLCRLSQLTCPVSALPSQNTHVKQKSTRG